MTLVKAPARCARRAPQRVGFFDEWWNVALFSLILALSVILAILAFLAWKDWLNFGCKKGMESGALWKRRYRPDMGRGGG